MKIKAKIKEIENKTNKDGEAIKIFHLAPKWSLRVHDKGQSCLTLQLPLVWIIYQHYPSEIQGEPHIQFKFYGGHILKVREDRWI